MSTERKKIEAFEHLPSCDCSKWPKAPPPYRCVSEARERAAYHASIMRLHCDPKNLSKYQRAHISFLQETEYVKQSMGECDREYFEQLVVELGE